MDNLKQYQMIIDYINKKEIKQPLYEFFKILIRTELQNDYSHQEYNQNDQIDLQILNGRIPDDYIETFEDIDDMGIRTSIQNEILSYYRESPESTLEDLEKIQKIFFNQFSNYKNFYRDSYQQYIKMHTDEHYPDYDYNFEQYMNNSTYDDQNLDNEEDIDDYMTED